MWFSTTIEGLKSEPVGAVVLLIFCSAVWSLAPLRWLMQTVMDSAFISLLVVTSERALIYMGMTSGPYPDSEDITVMIIATLGTLIGYYVFFGKRHRRRSVRLQEDLKEARALLAKAQERVSKLEDKLMEVEANGPDHEEKPVRIWMDGAFDMMHYGHMNAFRQGKALGTYLVVGVNSDKSITECKGPPVMNDQERLLAVQGCKFVNEVVTEVPYIMSEEYLDYVIEKYQIDYVVHGDDPCIVDGKDVYATAKAKGKYRSIPRTEGVSTTEIVGRMLLRSRAHHHKDGVGGAISPHLVSGGGPGQRRPSIDIKLGGSSGADGGAIKESLSGSIRGSFSGGGGDGGPIGGAEIGNSGSGVGGGGASGGGGGGGASGGGGGGGLAVDVPIERPMVRSKFLTTSRMIRLFSGGVKAPPEGPDTKVVYIDGAWDMFHAGHVQILKKALELGNYLVVGVHSDEVVNRRRGLNMPIMNLNERVLSVLGCSYVHDVLIDAPEEITKEMISSLGITAVVRGTVDDDEDSNGKSADRCETAYKVAIELDIFRKLDSPSTLTVQEIVTRIAKNEEYYQKKFARKKKLEDDYYIQRYKLDGSATSSPRAAPTTTTTATNGMHDMTPLKRA